MLQGAAAAARSATAGVPLLHDAIRTNDTRLVAAALGPYARHLDADGLAAGGAQVRVHRRAAGRRRPASTTRADAELAAMLAALAAERHAAGRSLPADAPTCSTADRDRLRP